MRRARVAALLQCLVPALLGSCRRDTKQTAPSPSGTSKTMDVVSATRDAGRQWTSEAAFSAPIGATRVAGVDVVAGLVAAEGVVRAIGVAANGTVWTADALRGVAWAPDAELRVQPAADGVAIFWRGLRASKPVRTLILLGPRGELRGGPIEVGPTFCATVDGLAWIGPYATGSIRVRARRWFETEARDVVTVPSDRGPALVCGDHDVVVLGDGDDDLTSASFAPGDTAPRPSIVASRDADFTDEEREHDAYSIGDDLGLVRVGVSGAIAMREIPRGGVPGPWRRLRHVLSADDDVVTVDGDTVSTLLVVTHDTDQGCPGVGSTAETVRALRVDRKTGEESILELAPVDCDHARGPFWIAQPSGQTVVAWVERRTMVQPKAATIDGVAYRVLGADGLRKGEIDQPADAFVGAGCDELGCSVAALLREPGSEGMQPAAIRIFAYP